MGSTIQYSKDYDIIVAGAGVAGISAALAAKEYCSNVALIEKTIFPGGLATAGNILAYMSLSDAWGNQVTFGMAEKLLLASLKFGPKDIPADWSDRRTSSQYKSWFNPASFMLSLDELLEERGVDVWFDTLICNAIVNDARITTVEVENKSGRGVLKARCFIDATGDADIAYRAGVACAEQDNYLSIWSLEASIDAARQAVRENSGARLLNLVISGSNDRGVGHPASSRKYHGTNGKDVSEFVRESRKLLRDRYGKKIREEGKSSRSNFFPLQLPAIAPFRTTRRIQGEYTLTSGEYLKHFQDCVGLVADWRNGKQIWELPYRCLYSKSVGGLLVAGRCISTSGQAWEVMRSIPAVALSGEVCGISAALCAVQAGTPEMVNVRELQQELARRSFINDVRVYKDALEFAEERNECIGN